MSDSFLDKDICQRFEVLYKLGILIRACFLLDQKLKER